MLAAMAYGDETPDQARLYETCLKGSREEIRNYCRSGDIASQYLKDGMNPMHVVVTAGRKDIEPILDIMLQSGFDVNAQTKSGEDTVLHLIVENMNVKEAFPLVLKILEFNPDLTTRNRKLRTAYDIAIAKEEYELAEALDGHMTAEQAREFYVKKIGALYGAKLIDAVLDSNENNIKEYLALGADPDFVNEHKNGAIHYAITHCKLPPQTTLSLLIEGGANVNLQDDEGDTALNLIIKMTRLRETGEMFKCAELLVNHGALSTFKDLDGNDALDLAKKRNYADIVRLLTSRRQAHIQEPDSISEPPPSVPPDSYLQTSHTGLNDIQEEEPAFDAEPVQAPAPVPDPPQEPAPRPAPSLSDLPPLPIPQDRVPEDEDYDHPPPMFNTEDQLTPQAHLAMAAKEGSPEDVRMALRDLGADPNIPDDHGLYPIHHACIREFDNEDDRLEMIRILMEYEADINVKTVNSESTALHIAATNNQDHVAQLLLDTHKCDYNAKNRKGQTPYEVATEEESPEVKLVIDQHRQAIRDRLRRGAQKASTCTLL